MSKNEETKNSGNVIKTGKDSIVHVGDGLNEEQTAELVGNQLDEKLKPIAQTVFDTANTVEMSVKELANTAKIASAILSNANAGYAGHLKAGWNYLCYGKFENAVYEFRDALKCDEFGHEAHFGLALAIHRIQLLDIGEETSSSKGFNKIPIYCEVDSDLYLENAFENDEHYKKAVDYSLEQPEIQHKYIDCAKKIREIIHAFHGYSRENRKYDCFICAKVTELDKNGNTLATAQTDDCAWAKKLHEKLKSEGLNPFFSENDIKGQAEIAGTEYEALILYALIHSKCMIIVCSDQKYFNNSRYMQNEYRRFVGFLRGNGRELDNIYLVRKNSVVNLPGAENREAYIRTEKDYDFQKVFEYVYLKTRGKRADSSAKKYCTVCGKGWDKSYKVCPIDLKELLSFEEYEQFKYNQIQENDRKAAEELARKQRELDEEKKRLQEENKEIIKAQEEFRKREEQLIQEKEQAERALAEERQRLSEEEQEVEDNSNTQIPSANSYDIANLELLEDVEVPEKCSKRVKGLFRSAKRGNATAQAALGECYSRGKGVGYDYSTAIEWWQRAASLGNKYAQFRLSECYRYGRGVDLNYSKAVIWCRKAAEKGLPKAQDELAWYYEKGLAVEQDYTKAIDLYKKAAKNGNESACRRLEKMYQEGLGVAADEKEGKKWKQRYDRIDTMSFIGIILWFVLLISSGVVFTAKTIIFGNKIIFPSTSGYLWTVVLSLLFVGVVILLLLFLRPLWSQGWKIAWKVTFEDLWDDFGAPIVLGVIAVIYILMVTILPLALGGIKTYDFGREGILYSIQSDGTVAVCDAESTIKNADIPEEIKGYKVSAIGDYAFSDCEKLTSVTIPESITYIGKVAFAGCDSLNTVYWNAVACEKVGWYYSIFGYIPNVSKVVFGDKVTIIPDSAFYDCSRLTSVILPDSLESIGVNAFCGCNSLRSIVIPSSVTNIGSTGDVPILPFGRCSSLTDVIVSADNANYFDIDGVLFDRERTRLIYYPEGREEKSYIIPEGVTDIAFYAFNNCNSLTRVTIPYTVSEVSSYAFKNASLDFIEVSEDNAVFNDIDGVLFKNNKTLVRYPAGKTNTTYVIPEGVTGIDLGAFDDCKSLTSITIPKSIRYINSSAFSGCDFSGITYEGTMEEWNASTFSKRFSCTVHCTDGDIE